jgi:hypothetical protein
MSNNKRMFTAMFEKYEETTQLLKRKTHFRDVRFREGGLIQEHLVFDEETSEKIIGHLTIGEFIAFLADVEFRNIEFQYPHATK